MPSPRELPQQIPTPWAKAWMRKPPGGGKFLVQILGVRGGMVMDEIDTCIIEAPDHWLVALLGNSRFCVPIPAVSWIRIWE